MEVKLNSKEILKLIDLYRDRELLWNMSSPLYRRNDLKNKAFEEIANEMHLPVDVIKKKIRSLRSTYTAEFKKVVQCKKSGSAAEEAYLPTVFWFDEMRFLDGSIVLRKSVDNSNQLISEASVNFEDLIEEEQVEANTSKCSNSSAKRARNENSKFDEALEKLMLINEKENNEFSAFGNSISIQLQKLPEDISYPLMGDIQNLLTQAKLKNIKKQRLIPVPSCSSTFLPSPSCSSLQSTRAPLSGSDDSTRFTSTPLHSPAEYPTSFRDILNTAIFEAEINFAEAE